MNFSFAILSLSLTSLCLTGCSTTGETTGATVAISTAGPATAGETSGGSGTTTTTTGSGTDSTNVPSTTLITTEDPATTDDTTGALFIELSDLPGELIDCSTYTEDCPDDQKCMPFSDDGGDAWNALTCVEVTGQGLHGDPCTVKITSVSGLDNCALHHMCLGNPDTLMGQCISFCDGSPEEPSCGPPNTSCIITNEGVLNICLPSCDPLLQNCPENHGCYPVNDTYTCVPSGASENSGLESDPCGFINNCQSGFACTQTEKLINCMSAMCCAPFCDLTEQDSCTLETMCRPIYGNNPDFPNVGFCGLPICNPLLQNCPQGQGCYPDGQNYTCQEVLVEDSGFEGDPCTLVNQCQPALTCLDPQQLVDCMHFRCCTPFCDLNAQDPCPNPETQCIALHENNPDYPHLGYCGAMQ